MFSLLRPSPSSIRRKLETAKSLPISYGNALNSQAGPEKLLVPDGYRCDHTRTQIGQGWQEFDTARTALRKWRHFDLGWVRIANPDAAIAPDAIVAVEVHALGLWSVNLSRILYVIDEPNLFGFGYGTTPLHLERGEERFLLEFSPATGAVYYELLAVSRPQNWLAWLGYPFTRGQQHKFARDSHRCMTQIVGKSRRTTAAS
jgi:uncharacterized protein (UPF0548 family)